MKAVHRNKKKYSFATEQQAKDMIEALWTSDEPYTFKSTQTINGHGVVYLGQLVQVDGQYDSEGNEVVAPILYDDFAVDVAWRPKQDVIEYDEQGEEISREVAIQDYEAWQEYEIEVENPKHKTY